MQDYKEFGYTMSSQKIRKAVFPAAGLGTRFLPATKATPKEMLALVDKPLIQYGVEEAVAAGCTEIIIVTGRGKNTIEDHFDRSPELEYSLRSRGKTELLKIACGVSKLAKISYVRQPEALGLGHAVLMAKELVGDEPFAVILPDDIVDAKVSCLKQMVDAFEKTQCSILGSDLVVWLPGLRAGCGRPAAAGGEGPGREAEAGRSAEPERDHRAVYLDAADLRADRTT
jgi:UTP--glucose-1-phosphate uridylyltransferase